MRSDGAFGQPVEHHTVVFWACGDHRRLIVPFDPVGCEAARVAAVQVLPRCERLVQWPLPWQRTLLPLLDAGDPLGRSRRDRPYGQA
jgi:hypothetical protein